MFRPSEPEPPVASVLLDDEDLGDIEAGFQQGLSEASLEPLPLPGWVPPAVGRVVRVPTHVRGWIQRSSNRKVVIVGSRLQLPLLTGAAFDGAREQWAADAADEFTIAAGARCARVREGAERTWRFSPRVLARSASITGTSFAHQRI